MSDSESDNEYYCDKCERYFASKDGLESHLQMSRNHNFCTICRKDFKTPSAVNGHMTSSVHQARDVRCPKCQRAFESVADCLSHVEGSTSCYGVSHQDIVRAVRKWERASGNPNLLTRPRIGWHDDYARSTPVITYRATEKSWNGSGYECYVCEKEFQTIGRLNQHLNSSVHESAEFRCKRCKFTCVRLSSLIRHIESEVCGFMTKKEVKKCLNSELHRYLK